MDAPVIGAVLACVGGVALAVGNDCLTRAVIRKRPSLLTPFFAVRQLVNVAFLTALYLLSPTLPWGMTPLLVGGALGITVPSVLLAMRLAKRTAAKTPGDETTADNTMDDTTRGKERE